MFKKILFFITVVLLVSHHSYGQFCKRDFFVQGCHYPIKNKNEIFEKVDSFLYSMSTQDSACTQFLFADDLNKWNMPFQEINNYIQSTDVIKPTIVGIMDFNPNEYIVKIKLNYFPDSVTESLLGIYNIVAVYNPITNTYKFKDYRTYFMNNNLDSLRLGNILYYKSNLLKLNKKECKAFDNFNNHIANIFQTPIKNITYFSFKNSQELMNFLGWDIVFNMFYAPTGGFARFGAKGTPFENLIYSGNNSEIYEHELIHLYFNTLLNTDSSSSTNIISEGIPTYFGGSSGLNYLELKQRLVQFLDVNDTATINKHFNKNIQIDKQTNYVYTMGAFIAELYYKKDKLAGLKKLANYTTTNFIENISKDFGVKEDELDNYLRTKIKM